MAVGDLLVLRVDSQIAEAIGGSSRVETVGELAHVDAIGTDHRRVRSAIPYMLKRHTPIRRRAVKDRIGRFIGARAKDGERFVRCAIGCNFRIKRLVP